MPPALTQAVIVGPSFARCLVQQDFTSVMLATSSLSFAEKLKEILQNDYFHLRHTNDLLGVSGAPL